ncbi:DinB family protein [Sporosarcina beigongshangi]|uniref:DinB family protein n=1 Tax=Sporosarcina beigongshangi TaxID=2782538 RepID=UPI00193AC791|nr:DinB family protein [Sporosarcina beigongshangi]
MLNMFQYNWQVRDDWFEWSQQISIEELTQKRTGGMGSILQNLFHVIDCEQIWINQMNGTPVIMKDINGIFTLQEVIESSNSTKLITQGFMQSWTPDSEDKVFEMQRRNGTTSSFTYGKIMRHIISHEIHHVGQLSVWSRELAIKPVSSDLLFREY